MIWRVWSPSSGVNRSLQGGNQNQNDQDHHVSKRFLETFTGELLFEVWTPIWSKSGRL